MTVQNTGSGRGIRTTDSQFEFQVFLFYLLQPSKARPIMRRLNIDYLLLDCVIAAKLARLPPTLH